MRVRDYSKNVMECADVIEIFETLAKLDLESVRSVGRNDVCTVSIFSASIKKAMQDTSLTVSFGRSLSPEANWLEFARKSAEANGIFSNRKDVTTAAPAAGSPVSEFTMTEAVESIVSAPVDPNSVLVDITYADKPDEVFDTKSDGGTNGVSDGIYYHKFPAGHKLSGPTIRFEHPAVSDFSLELEIRLNDLLVWTAIPRHGTEQESHCCGVLLCPTGIQEIRDYSYAKTDDQWKESRRLPIQTFPRPNEGKGEWMKIRILRIGNECTYLQDGQIVATTKDENPRQDDVQDLPGEISLWLLPAIDGPTSFELRSLKLSKL